jgi:hypothetical protein
MLPWRQLLMLLLLWVLRVPLLGLPVARGLWGCTDSRGCIAARTLLQLSLQAVKVAVIIATACLGLQDSCCWLSPLLLLLSLPWC